MLEILSPFRIIRNVIGIERGLLNWCIPEKTPICGPLQMWSASACSELRQPGRALPAVLTAVFISLQSGAIMTVLAAVCTKIPEGRLAIIFLPVFTFTAGNVSTRLTFTQPLKSCLKLEVEHQNCTVCVFSSWLLGLKSHHCHGYSWDDPGMEIF